MRVRELRVIAATAVAGLCLAVSACSGGSSAKVVRLGAARTRFGIILTTPDHRGLYFLKGEGVRNIMCTGQCIRQWRPYAFRGRNVRVVLPSGFSRPVTLSFRGGVGYQLIYDSHPLYVFVGDRPGQFSWLTTSQLDAEWVPVFSDAGEANEGSPPETSPPTKPVMPGPTATSISPPAATGPTPPTSPSTSLPATTGSTSTASLPQTTTSPGPTTTLQPPPTTTTTYPTTTMPYPPPTSTTATYQTTTTYPYPTYPY